MAGPGIQEYRNVAAQHADAARITERPNDAGLKAVGSFKAKTAAFFTKNAKLDEQNSKAIAHFGKALETTYGAAGAAAYNAHLRTALLEGKPLTGRMVSTALATAKNELLKDPAANAVQLAKAGHGGEVIDAIMAKGPTTIAAYQNLSKALIDVRGRLDAAPKPLDPNNPLIPLRVMLDLKVTELATTRAEGQLGNGKLHNMATLGANKPQIMHQVHVNPPELNRPNEVGATPLAMSMLVAGNHAMATELLRMGANPNAGALFGAFKPLDLARGVNQGAAIANIKNAGGQSGVDSAKLEPNAVVGKSTCDILALGTLSSTPESTAAIHNSFQSLYANDDFKPILNLAAQKMVGDSANELGALRVFHIPNRDASLFTGMLAGGAYNDANETLVMASKEGAKDMEGTLIHELTHHAVQTAFGNGVMPFPKSELDDLKAGKNIDGTTLKSYLDAISADLALAAPTDPVGVAVRETILGRVASGYSQRGEALPNPYQDITTAMLQEYIVGVPQAIHEHGFAAAQQVGPNLTAFFQNNLLPAVTTKADEMAERIPTANPQPNQVGGTATAGATGVTDTTNATIATAPTDTTGTVGTGGATAANSTAPLSAAEQAHVDGTLAMEGMIAKLETTLFGGGKIDALGGLNVGAAIEVILGGVPNGNGTPVNDGNGVLVAGLQLTSAVFDLHPLSRDFVIGHETSHYVTVQMSTATGVDPLDGFREEVQPDLTAAYLLKEQGHSSEDILKQISADRNKVFDAVDDGHHPAADYRYDRIAELFDRMDNHGESFTAAAAFVLNKVPDLATLNADNLAV